MFIMVLYRHTDTFLACIPINAPKCFSLLMFFLNLFVGWFLVYHFIDVRIIRKQILRAVFQTSEVLIMKIEAPLLCNNLLTGDFRTNLQNL